jgi:hypothetical protein
MALNPAADFVHLHLLPVKQQWSAIKKPFS